MKKKILIKNKNKKIILYKMIKNYINKIKKNYLINY